MEAALISIKELLCSATCLTHPDPQADISLAVDASDRHVGAVLQQLESGSWRPLAFYSKKLDATQVKYSAFDRELLAAYLAVRHFRYLLEGRQFTLYTDHKPLTFALKSTTDPWTVRQQRQLAYLADFSVQLCHVKGTDNVVADALLRPEAAAGETGAGLSGAETCPGLLSINRPGPQSSYLPLCSVQQLEQLDFAALAAAQETCSDFCSLRNKCQAGNVQLSCDVSTGVARPLVPDVFRETVFNIVHSIAHPGGKSNQKTGFSTFCVAAHGCRCGIALL
jgi:RNase H-like domain found in reverse transcriptase